MLLHASTHKTKTVQIQFSSHERFSQEETKTDEHGSEVPHHDLASTVSARGLQPDFARSASRSEFNGLKRTQFSFGSGSRRPERRAPSRGPLAREGAVGRRRVRATEMCDGLNGWPSTGANCSTPAPAPRQDRNPAAPPRKAQRVQGAMGTTTSTSPGEAWHPEAKGEERTQSYKE